MESRLQQHVLFLDTSGPVGTVALAIDGALRSLRRSTEARDHAAVINVAIQEVLEESGMPIASLTAVCVMAGPGSYTGLRIGLATAKGLCYALDIPLFLQNNLQVLVMDARDASSEHYQTWVSVLPARTGEYFLAVYGADGEEVFPPRHLEKREAADIVCSLKHPLASCGSEEAAREIFPASAPPHLRGEVSIEPWIRLGFNQIKQEKAVSLGETVPFYLKKPFTTSAKPRG